MKIRKFRWSEKYFCDSCIDASYKATITRRNVWFQNIPFAYMSAREIDLRFQYRYKDTYPKAIGLVSAGLIDLKSLVTHRFNLEEGEEDSEPHPIQQRGL